MLAQRFEKAREEERIEEGKGEECHILPTDVEEEQKPQQRWHEVYLDGNTWNTCR